MTGIEMLIGATALAGKEALKKAVDALYDASGDNAKKALKSTRNDRQMGKLFQQLAKVRKVKTLGQLDHAVDLTEFYCDSHVHKRSQRIKVSSLDDLKINGSVLIEGIAGQGKSIFLRYLCGMETMKGDYLPVFAELRRVQEKETLVNFVIRTLKGFHIEVEEKMLGELMSSGKLLLMLDAFDEVRDDAKSRILDELEDFAASHEKLRIIITSRPDSGIAACPQFEVVRLSDLKNDEWTVVIEKITEDAEVALELINQVRHHTGGIRELLLTPLLVTLLVIRYKSYQELPAQLSDFYDSLFQVLLQRHDGIKPGYRRSRRCAMNDQEYRNVFESFCFFSKQSQDQEIRESDVYDNGKASLQDNGSVDDATGFISDIVKITCLLVKDGEEYRYIHKSVQEYYAASYIRRKPEVVAGKLYKKLFDRHNWWRFPQELSFLEEIDEYRYNKYGVLPYLKRFFSVQSSKFCEEVSEAEIATVRNWVSHMQAAFSAVDEKLLPRRFRWPQVGPFRNEMEQPLHSFMFSTEFKSMCIKYLKAQEKTETSLTPVDELVNGNLEAQATIRSLSVKIATLLFERAKKALTNVNSTERFTSVAKMLK